MQTAILALIPALVAITNVSPTMGEEGATNDTVHPRGRVTYLFAQFALTMFVVSLLTYYRLTTMTTESVSQIEWLILTIILLGFVIRMWSYMTLGPNFTFVIKTSPNQPLITFGPYSILAHPSYLGQLMVMVGATFYLSRSMIATGAVLAYGLLRITNRITIEEEAMRAKFGPSYDAYLAKRWKLVPLIY